MSHFVVLVIGDNVDQQLAPFNAQPKDGDPYVTLEFHDQTDDFRRQYDEGDVEIIKRPDGSWVLVRFAHTATDDDKPVSVKFSELYPTFEEFCKKWHGVEPNEQGRYGYFYNPKGKWDWYQIGGRWTGYFKAFPGAVGKVGEPGVFGNKPKPGWYDQIRRGSIDFDGMRAEAAAEANKRYDAYEAAVAGLEVPKRWAEFRTAYENIDDAREAYHKTPYITTLRNANLLPWYEDPVEVYGVGREKFIERACNGVFAPYAVLKDGEWFSKDDESWFGMNSGYVDPKTWNDRVWELLRDLPEDTLITAVDCHI
ncbi:MAG: hypothetical protein KatS3mg015_2653 [Fimbriimonadales bacterium]|nr:MAG: hypothetical protein KatS3mg015_2653 [Fimbriimonadales bacterium]